MGKESRFEELFLPYLDAAYNLARWMVSRDQDAADIVQEAYARALQGFSEFHRENPRAWLLNIVRNTADSWLTKPRREKELMRSDEEPAHPPLKILLSGLSQERQRRLQKELTSLHQVSDSRSGGPSRTGGDQHGLPATQCEPHGH
jgi:RNA polymerase sigma factor (sigma-70 family)